MDFAARIGEAFASRRVSLARGANKVSLTLKVERPRLWWPNGAGDQPLYDFCASLGE